VLTDPLLTVDEARDTVLARARTLPPARLPLSMARGCVLAEDVAVDRDSPPFAKSLVDGFAVRSADVLPAGGPLRVVEELFAGAVPTRPLGPREAASIMTGAPLPDGADAVVMLEYARRDAHEVTLNMARVEPGANVLPRGREMRAGDIVLRRGERLGAARLGVLASVGCASPLVVPAPWVSILPTGDELVEADEAPGPGQIRNANAVVLESLVVQAGGVPLLLPIAPDDPDILARDLEDALLTDVVVITGGVSAGQRDLVPAALERLGVARVFHKVRLKPGKPLWFGIGPERGAKPGALVFGLPGNPVSGVVGTLLFVRPALEALAGRTVAGRDLPGYPLAQAFEHRGDRPTYHPVAWAEPGGGAERALVPLPWAGSADLLTVARADGFACFPPGDRRYAPGDVVGFLNLS
jgi:molybdopterin molybdotransferase